MRFHIFSAAILAGLISLVGCSGGSSNNANPNPTPQSYGFFRKLNGKNQSAKQVINTSSENVTITMSAPRAGHKAIQITNDIFMLIGGEIADGQSSFDRAVEKPSTIDYFDKTTETFTHKNIITNISRRCYSDGTLSFGLLRLQDGNILMVGGADKVNDTIEIFNPLTEVVTLYKNVFPDETPVNNITNMFYMGNNKVLLVGCRYTDMSIHQQITLRGNAVLDLTTMKATILQVPTLVYRESAVQVADGSVVIMGGMEQDCIVIHKEIWKVDSNFVTTKIADMSTERFAFGATLLNDGKVGIYGGVNYVNGMSYPKSVDIYNPVDNSVTKSTDLPMPRNSTSPIMLQNGFVLNAGGSSNGDLVSVETVHNHITGVVGSTGNLTTARRFFSTIPLNNGRYLISGGDGDSRNNASLNTAEIYDSASKITIYYANTEIATESTMQFTANKSCTWSVTELETDKESGSISSDGLFTASKAITKAKITATSSDGYADVVISIVKK